MANIGICTFPGINYVRSARYTRGLGIVPDSAMLEIVPQTQSIQPEGALIFDFDGTGVAIPECRVDFGSVKSSASGHVVRLRILDKRWKWKFGYISGRYNIKIKDPNGGLTQINKTGTEKTVRELASLCLDEMGETLYDVSVLPDDLYPSVNWVYENPAYELQRLCNAVGCDVCLQLDNSVRIVQLGVGNPLPNSGSIRVQSSGINAPEAPSRIAVVCAPTVFARSFPLEAVVQDDDGVIRKLEDSLNKPTQGTGEDWRFYLPGSRAILQANLLSYRVENSVYKWYRIETPDSVAGYDGEINSLEQLLPLIDESPETYEVTEPDGTVTQRRQPSAITGSWSREKSAGGFYDMGSGPYTGRYSLSKPEGIVRFDEAVYRLKTGQTGDPENPEVDYIGTEPANFSMFAKFNIKDSETNQHERHVYEYEIPGSASETEGLVVRVPELWKEVQADGSSNEQQLDLELMKIAEAVAAQYTNAPFANRVYNGLIPINPDGAIRQVGWQVDHIEGASTWASLNAETDVSVRSILERRRMVTSRESQEEVKREEVFVDRKARLDGEF